MISRLVSIIIPVYNRQQFITHCLDSVVSQSYTDWECLVIDDGSTDNTREVVDNYNICDRRIKLFDREREPKGAPTCRNIGIENAKGEYIMFLDSDDLLASYCLEQRVYAIRDIGYSFVVFNTEFFTNRPGDLRRLWNISTNENDLVRFFKRDVVWSVGGGLFDKDFLIRSNINFDETITHFQDIDFHIRLLLQRPYYRKCLDEKPDYFCRRHSGITISQKNKYGLKTNTVYLFNKYAKSMGELTEDEKTEYLKYYFGQIKIHFFKKEFREFRIRLGDIMKIHRIKKAEVAAIYLNLIYASIVIKFLKRSPKRSILLFSSTLRCFFRPSKPSFLGQVYRN